MEWREYPMKKISAVLLTLIAFSCTSNKIKTFNTADNRKSIVLETFHKVVSGKLDNYQTIYKKDIINGASTPITVSMSFWASTDIAFLDDYLSIKTDTNTYKLKFINKKSRIESQQTGSVMGNMFGIYQSWRHLYGEIQLPAVIEKDLLASKNIYYYISAGGTMTELHVIDKQLVKLKEFLSIKN